MSEKLALRRHPARAVEQVEIEGLVKEDATMKAVMEEIDLPYMPLELFEFEDAHTPEVRTPRLVRSHWSRTAARARLLSGICVRRGSSRLGGCQWCRGARPARSCPAHGSYTFL